MSEELIALVGSAKTRIDAGFSQVGRTLSVEDAVARALMILSARAVANANALSLLAEHNHANEALPILRSLLETAVQMRWISAKDSEARARGVLEERRSADWGNLWPEDRLRLRAREIGFAGDIFDRALSWCRLHLHANAAGLPWGHMYSGKDDDGISADEVLRATADVMGHVVKALDERWTGKFPGAEEMWKKANTNVRRGLKS